MVGAAGNNNANQNWGPGYVGGGDIKNELNYADSTNTSIAYLSMNDSKGVGAANWANVVSFNGLWPTAAGAGIHGNISTNDYTPITTGMYPCWGNEVLVHIVDPKSGGYTDQDITKTQLGNQTVPGSLLGVLNAQSYLNGGSLTVGSIENEIELSKPNGAVAIRLSDMTSSRQNVGGVITPGPVN